jgi:hypothetical protein
MATPEMVERVARALAETDGYGDWDRLPTNIRSMFQSHATTAIKAMRMEVTLRRGNIRENGEFARGMAAFGLELLDAIDAALRTPNGDRNE